jgi:TetR/AcrR family tetracycline transcriptional repressor
VTQSRQRSIEGAAGSRRRGWLNRSLILETALALTDRDGIDALTMRAVGEELGVEAMSLYHHVANKNALIDGMVEVFSDRIRLDGEVYDGRRDLRTLGRRFRQEGFAHPDAVRLLAVRALQAPAWRRPVEDTFASLLAGGFDPEDAVHAYRIVWSYIVGYVLNDLRMRPVRSMRPLLAKLPRAEFPATHAVASALQRTDRDAEFELGLDVVIAGLSRD